MNIGNIFVYAASTMVVVTIGFFAHSFVFIAIAFGGNGSFWLVVIGLGAMTVCAYYMVKKTRIVWWLPAVAYTTLSLALGVSNDTPEHLLICFFILLPLIAMAGGKAHYDKPTITKNSLAKERTPRAPG